MLVAAPGAQARFVNEPGWQSITVMIMLELFSQHLLARHRVGEFYSPSDAEILSVNGVRVGELFDWGQRVVDRRS
jgi:hypothetical protein